MSYTLIISEKPDAARRIAEAIADKKPKKVEKRGAPYYEFSVKNKKHICVPAVGHLFVLTPSKDNSKGWTYPVFNLEWTPTYTRKNTSWTEKYFKNIQELAKNASDFIDAADLDTEGEVILFNILRFICGIKDAKRMKFSTLTKDELREAYRKMDSHIIHAMVESGLTRHNLDALYGFNLTRALTLAMKSSADKGFAILSTGRVQGPTLAMLLERELDIRKFKPKPFWQLDAIIKINNAEFIATYEKEKIWKKEDAASIYRVCEKLGTKAIVKNIKKRKYKQKPPVPFNTTDMQSEAYAQFKFSPKHTLSIVESLYQAGAVSYPRSSSQKLPPSINYSRILKSLTKLTEYKTFAKELLKKSKLIPNEGKRTDPAHPAIYPTFEPPAIAKLTGQQKRMYDLIVRRFMAVFAKDALRESITVDLDVEGNKFRLNGKTTIEPGWTKYYGKYLAFEEQQLPELKVGDELDVKKIDMLEKETQPPGRFSQGSILKEMEKHGIGTRATRAEILQTLYNRKYITGKSINVTKLGETVTTVLKKHCPRILSEELTRRFEEEMEEVYNSKKKREQVVKEAKNILIETLGEFKNNEKEIGKQLLDGLIESRKEERTLGICPKCSGELRIIKSKRTGLSFVGCTSYPKCDNSYPLPHRARYDKTGRMCKKCGTPIIRIIRKYRRPFNMCLLPSCPTKAGWRKKKGKYKSKSKKSSPKFS